MDYPFLSKQFIRKHAILTFEEIENVLNKVSRILDKESKLINLSRSDVYFLGDTHGNFALTIHAFKHFFPIQDSYHSKFDKIVFLGDFIDRGPYCIENISFLLSMKVMYPDRVVLIRGNHETREINIRFDFYDKVIRRYGMGIFERFNHVFAKLPLAILTWNNIFAVHGGIPEGLENLNDLNGLEDQIDPEDRITFQLLWNDPVERNGWFYQNFRGKFSKKFGQKAFDHFISSHNIRLIVRAHEVQRKGYRKYFKTQLISLDSSASNWRKQNYSVFILHAEGDYHIAKVEEFEKTNFEYLYAKK